MREITVDGLLKIRSCLQRTNNTVFICIDGRDETGNVECVGTIRKYSRMFIIVPPYRNFSTKPIMRLIKQRRGVAKRMRRAINIARIMGLKFQKTR